MVLNISIFFSVQVSVHRRNCRPNTNNSSGTQKTKRSTLIYKNGRGHIHNVSQCQDGGLCYEHEVRTACKQCDRNSPATRAPYGLLTHSGRVQRTGIVNRISCRFKARFYSLAAVCDYLYYHRSSCNRTTVPANKKRWQCNKAKSVPLLFFLCYL